MKFVLPCRLAAKRGNLEALRLLLDYNAEQSILDRV
jgi:hypothetical protein